MKHIILILTILLPVPQSALRGHDSAKPLKVFILAGQSNMEGQAVSDLAGKDYNGGQCVLSPLPGLREAVLTSSGALRHRQGLC